MTNRQLVTHSPAARQCKSRRVRTALASVTRSCMVTFLLAASVGLTAAQTSQINSQPTTRALAVQPLQLSPEAARVADLIDVTPLLDQLTSKRAAGSPMSPESMTIHQEITERGLCASPDIVSVSAVIDSEIEQIRGLLLRSAIFLGSSTPTAAQKSDLDGTYTLDDADSDNIAKAIEDAVGKLNFLTRPIARGRLKKLNPTYHQVAIASSPNEISVSVDDQPPLRAPANGTPVAWVGPDGGKVKASMQLAGGRLVQTFNSADGRRVNEYTLSPDGRMLTMQVTETSPRLSQAIRYKQVYRRVS